MFVCAGALLCLALGAALRALVVSGGLHDLRRALWGWRGYALAQLAAGAALLGLQVGRVLCFAGPHACLRPLLCLHP